VRGVLKATRSNRKNRWRDSLREVLVMVGLPRSYFTKRKTKARRVGFENALLHLKPAMRVEARRLWA